jgi:hypothetical protein
LLSSLLRRSVGEPEQRPEPQGAASFLLLEPEPQQNVKFFEFFAIYNVCTVYAKEPEQEPHFFAWPELEPDPEPHQNNAVRLLTRSKSNNNHSNLYTYKLLRISQK